MAGEVEKLNIIGNFFNFFAEGLFLLASIAEAKGEESGEDRDKEAAGYLATTFNIVGAWTQLFGDYILFKAAQQDLEENLQSAEQFDGEAARMEVMVAGFQVVTDVLEVQLAERAAEVVK